MHYQLLVNSTLSCNSCYNCTASYVYVLLMYTYAFYFTLYQFTEITWTLEFNRYFYVGIKAV